MRYELLIKLRDQLHTVKDSTMRGLLRKSLKCVGDDLWVSQLEIGIEDGGTLIKDFKPSELEILADKDVQIGKPTEW